MLRIRKGRPPRILATLRRTPGITWEGVPGDAKAALREALLEEQGFLCAYCMRRVEAGFDNAGHPYTHVEHWSPRSGGADPLAWKDLLAVCTGDLDGGPHCDRAKADRPLTLHPAHPRQDVERAIAYQADGRITTNPAADAATLNLNQVTLRRSRRAVHDATVTRIASADATQLRAWITHWERLGRDGHRQPYAGVALSLLRRRLQSLSDRTRRIHQR